MELSKGTMGIDQFPGAQLGQEPVMLQKIRTGDIDFIITSTANASSVAPQAGVFSLHFIFRDKDHLIKCWPIRRCRRNSAAMIKDSVQGRACARPDDHGHAQHVLQEGINSVADIKGQKIRVQATMTEDAHFPAYGTQTVHMPFGEVYTSLQTGVVESPRTASTSTWRTSTTKWRRCSSMTEHEANNNCIWVSDKAWKSFTRNSRVGCRRPPTKSPRRSRRWRSS